ncbi:MAG: PHP N-terminal domain protein [uncultured Thermomicrobiales bacterium]|uniref:PHP N-terminal domain protein n=1 Tax=uncultured Thermomicrobiales bacterium TaxID=1645740 RepID=A0A6J4UCY3_9BACT|nr:MAG: PHP N-terminal domain protein [uncultured Thermomicrobiales bacterium]
MHTPASIDYQEPDTSPLQLLQAAEAKGLDIIAFTDHNSVRGYADLWREIEDLELLEYLRRLQPAEAARLTEYRRLLAKILVLPGFEFTATFGFHILAIFPEQTSVRLMEHLLLQLGVPEDRIGSGEVGATSDVLKVYELLDEHGALVIGAHVNSTHGIAMQGLRFGGQTKIAYTQDPHLHGLEVTDLMLDGGRRSTARFFNGTKAEYPRRMHCIQGSDAHRLTRDPNRETNLGIGDRPTEVELPEVSFRALKDLFLSDHFDRVRGYVGLSESVQLFRDDRAQGNTADQAFHESLSTKRTGVSHILRDLVAFANGDGGMIYVGASAFEKRPIVGVPDVEAATAELRTELAQQVTPLPEVEIESISADGKDVLVLRVSPGTEKPYALSPGNIYVRELADSALASRDQIVAMVRATAEQVTASAARASAQAPAAVPAPMGRPAYEPRTAGQPARNQLPPAPDRSPAARRDRDRPDDGREARPRDRDDSRSPARPGNRYDDGDGRDGRDGRDVRTDRPAERNGNRTADRDRDRYESQPRYGEAAEPAGNGRNGGRSRADARPRYDREDRPASGPAARAETSGRYDDRSPYDDLPRDEPPRGRERGDGRPPARRESSPYDRDARSGQFAVESDRYDEPDRPDDELQPVDRERHDVARSERARENRSQYDESSRQTRNDRDDRDTRDDDGPRREERRNDAPREDQRRDGRGQNRSATRYADREPAPLPFAPVPVGISPDGGQEEHIQAAPDRISPSSGVEILAAADVDGVPFFTLHDLRHEEIIRNVTGDTGRRLWRYAIEQFEDLDASLAATRWDGDYGFVKSYRPRGGERRYNLAYRGGGEIRVFYGVADEDIHDGWRAILPARGR